jgi:hypothetical protein
MQDFAPVKVLEIVFEILQYKRGVPQESPQEPEPGSFSLRIAHPGIIVAKGGGDDKLWQAIPAKSGLNREGLRLNGDGLI